MSKIYNELIIWKTNVCQIQEWLLTCPTFVAELGIKLWPPKISQQSARAILPNHTEFPPPQPSFSIVCFAMAYRMIHNVRLQWGNEYRNQFIWKFRDKHHSSSFGNLYELWLFQLLSKDIEILLFSVRYGCVIYVLVYDIKITKWL